MTRYPFHIFWLLMCGCMLLTVAVVLVKICQHLAPLLEALS